MPNFRLDIGHDRCSAAFRKSAIIVFRPYCVGMTLDPEVIASQRVAGKCLAEFVQHRHRLRRQTGRTGGELDKRGR